MAVSKRTRFEGVCRTMLQQRMDEARKIIGGGDV